ncbi:MAG: nuclear transport factor 2 family protein [Casimicrobiaceae bacterium]
MTPVDVVQRQLEAYNARDLDRFVAEYSDNVTVTKLPAIEAAIVGKIRFTEFYATQRFNLPGLHAELVNRIALGNKVIDHERITGVQPAPFEMVVIYEVADSLIQRVWSLSPA